MFSQQEVALTDEIRRCDIVGVVVVVLEEGRMPFGVSFGISKAQGSPSVCLFVWLLLQHPVGLCAAELSSMRTTN